MKKVALNLTERLTLIHSLPQEGNFVTMRTKQHLDAELNLTKEEIEEWDVKAVSQENGMTSFTWNEKANSDREFDLSKRQVEVIEKALDNLDKKNALTANHLTLCQKFGMDDEEE